MGQPTPPNYTCPQCKTKIPFGTADNPPPSSCPNCHKQLVIPTWYSELPSWIILGDPSNDSRDSLAGGGKGGMKYSLKQLFASTGLIALGFAPMSYMLHITEYDPNAPDLVHIIMSQLLLYSGIPIGVGVSALASRRWQFLCFVLAAIAWTLTSVAVFAVATSGHATK